MPIKLTGLAVFTACLLFSQSSKDMEAKFTEAEQRISRLPPSAFPDLPTDIVQALTRRGCTIPQTGFPNKPHNVIRGEFTEAGKSDWAILCSVQGASSVLVFHKAATRNPVEIARVEDKGFLQDVGGDKISFSRSISAVGKDYIMQHYQTYGGPEPPPVNHQGIDDAFLEKASVVHYYHNGKWLELTGAD